MQAPLLRSHLRIEMAPGLLCNLSESGIFVMLELVMKRSFPHLLSLGLIASVGLTCGLASVAYSETAKLPTVIDEVMAKKNQDIAMIKKLIASDKVDLAGAFALDLKTKKAALLTGDKYFAAVVSSYAFGDLNADGIQDLAVAVETAGAPVAPTDSRFGARQLRVYLGESSGTLKLFRKADHVLLRRDANTSGEEAFNAVQINSKTGSLIVSHLISDPKDASMIQVDVKQRFVMKAGDLVLANQREIHVGIEGTRYEDQDFEKAQQSVRILKQIGGPSTVFTSKMNSAALVKIEDASVTKLK